MKRWSSMLLSLCMVAAISLTLCAADKSVYDLLINVHLIEGTDILTDIRGLTFDLIHPSDNGMIQMGRNLAEKLKQLLK